MAQIPILHCQLLPMSTVLSESILPSAKIFGTTRYWTPGFVRMDELLCMWGANPQMPPGRRVEKTVMPQTLEKNKTIYFREISYIEDCTLWNISEGISEK